VRKEATKEAEMARMRRDKKRLVRKRLLELGLPVPPMTDDGRNFSVDAATMLKLLNRRE
jgi:hypothetical protein